MLGLLFFIVAAFYASVGFGGGSSYLALLVLWELPYTAIPILALTCNICVVAGNSIHYAREGYVVPRLIIPLAIISVPMAYLGGSIPLSKELFLLILFPVLLVTGVRLLVQHRQYDDVTSAYRPLALLPAIILGAGLGFVAGITGIGGGIFLAPLLYWLRAGSPKQIAATASLFILVNSLAGLLGQWQKTGVADALSEYWYLPLVALAGGQVGTLLTIRWLPLRMIALLTALLVLAVAARLGWLIWGIG